MQNELVAVSAVIATRNRPQVLRRTLESLAAQGVNPFEVVIIDGSEDSSTRSLCLDEGIPGLRSRIFWEGAVEVGAACQRNQGVKASSQPVIWFMDDDILLEPLCFSRLIRALTFDAGLGGVNAMITNQRYRAPGRIGRLVYQIISGNSKASFAGRVLGPAVNVLPEDRDDLPEIVQVEWLNTGCTLYRREALPNPPFPSHFKGYSLMEDVALSLTVSNNWRLANARTARIYHDSQPGSYKSDPRRLAEMELLNRHYVMTKVLGRNRFSDYLKLCLYELFAVAAGLEFTNQEVSLRLNVLGKADALRTLVRHS